MFLRVELRSDRCSIRPLVPSDLDPLLELRVRNRAFFSAYEPQRQHADDGYSRPSIERLILGSDRAWQAGEAYGFGIFGDGRLVGRVALSNVVRAAWQNATLGYYVDQAENGKGYATEAVKLIVRFAFEHADLHRVQAGVMPRNVASRRVLEKAGFAYEGMARYYLQIAGVWEDHRLFAVTPEVWDESR